MLVAFLLWHKKLRKELEWFGFEFNPYDPCVANKTYHGQQQTVRFYVDDLLWSCMEVKANDELFQWAQEKFGHLKPITVTRGKNHEFLEMTLDFGIDDGTCHVLQGSHVSDMMETLGKKVKTN